MPAQIAKVLGLPPRDRFAIFLLQLAPRASSRTLALLSLLCAAYITICWVEAYGLWRGTVWAEWFGVFSGLVYLPLKGLRAG